jgi:hypothetical protein
MSVSRAALEFEAQEASSDLHSARRTPRGFDCDSCEKFFEGEPYGSGLFIWTRGDEVRYEEPPLCKECAEQITMGALRLWDSEEEEEG